MHDPKELWQAARDGDLARLRALLASGVDVEHPHWGWTPLYYAACNGHTACLEALLATGASVHSVHSSAMDGWTPLHCASFEGHAACVCALISAGAVVNRTDRRGNTPFYHALNRGHCRVLKILLRAGADVQRIGRAARWYANTSAWALVDEIRAAGGGQNYATRRRAALVRAFSGKVSKYVSAHIISFEPPGGD